MNAYVIRYYGRRYIRIGHIHAPDEVHGQRALYWTRSLTDAEKFSSEATAMAWMARFMEVPGEILLAPRVWVVDEDSA